MNHTLQKAITEFVFERLEDSQLVNHTTNEFRLYIYDNAGEYLIGGAAVANFITQFIKLVRGDEQ